MILRFPLLSSRSSSVLDIKGHAIPAWAVLAVSLLLCLETSKAEQIVLSDEKSTILTQPELSSSDIGRSSVYSTAGDFRLQHILHHGAGRYPNMLRRLDITQSTKVWIDGDDEPQSNEAVRLKAHFTPIRRMQDRSKEVVEAALKARRTGLVPWQASASSWVIEDVLSPNVSDKETVLNLAKMTANAYVHVPSTEDWRDVGEPWNHSGGFGWENDGLRGHIYVDQTNSTVIISIKGTSFAVFYGEETKANDKINDNLLFSCCCARVSAFWSTVCNCYTDTFSCSSPCLTNALKEENRYYRAALNLYYNVTHMYPGANIWVVGHSLGGALSALVGQTYGLPAITFEAPPDAMAASRLGIPVPPGRKQTDGMTGVIHFGNNADPIWLGVCNGATSFCSIGGYAMESKCHTGKMCLYDVVTDLHWRVNADAHRIRTMIDQVIEKYDKVPECIPESEECAECFNWNFHSGNITTTTTTSSSSSTTSTTRSTTCKTPGWWGCLDDSPTSTASTTTPATTTSSSTLTRTCTHYGWFGECLDPTSTASITQVPSRPRTLTTKTSTVISTTTSSATGCSSPGYFWGCRDA